MTIFKPIAQLGFLMLGPMLFASGCVFVPHGGNGGPQEGYYDRDHNRWYHENRWQGCAEHDEHCR